MRALSRLLPVAALLAALGALSACDTFSSNDVKAEYPDKRRPGDTAPTYGGKRDTVFGEGGLNIFGGDEKKRREGEGGGGGLGVNSFLWRASLDTIVFMPVSSADPFGGVIITDWHTPAETPSERFKLNVYILGRALRADGVRVAVFRQVADGAGGWKDAPVPQQAGTDIENAILTRARQLRQETVNQ
jgi:hypothetical protein